MTTDDSKPPGPPPPAQEQPPSTGHQAPGTGQQAPGTGPQPPASYPDPSLSAPPPPHHQQAPQPPGPGPQAPGTGHPAPSTGHQAPGPPYPAPSTGHPAPSTGHPAPGTGHPAPSTGHPAPSTGHRAPSTGHPAPSTGHRAPGTGPPAPGTGQPAWAGQPPESQLGGGGANAVTVAVQTFFSVHLKRALRINLRFEDVLPKEREALEAASLPASDPGFLAFLAWRRSLLLVAGVFLVPVVILSAVETFANQDPSADTQNTLLGLLWTVTAVFTVAVWVLARSWTDWAKQRRRLFRFWLVFFLAPFLLWLFPFRSLAPGATRQQAVLIGVIFSVVAVLTLAPKALSLMPGLIRASMVAKGLFPGAAAPGWLITLSAPIYALIVYVILLTPYQITGNPLFVLAMIGLIGAPLWLAKVGYDLARPMTAEDSSARIKKSRGGYLAFNGFGLLFLFIALIDLASQLEIGFLSALNLILALIANVLLLSLIATDLVLVNLGRASGLAGDPGSQALRTSYDQRLADFLRSTREFTPVEPPSPENPT